MVWTSNGIITERNSMEENDIVFSLLVPTRYRTVRLLNLLDSIETTTHNPLSVEVLIAYDDDDAETDKFLSSLKTFRYNVRIYKRTRSSHLCRDYYNIMAEQANGKYIWALNDDVILITQSWDQILSAKIEGFLADKKDRICYIGIHDNTDPNTDVSPEGKNGYTCFPMVTREYVKIVGRFLFESTPAWGGDGAIWELFKKVPSRILNARQDIYVNHICIHNHYMQNKIDRRNLQDITSRELENKFVQNPIDIKAKALEEQAAYTSIKNAIQAHSKV